MHQEMNGMEEQRSKKDRLRADAHHLVCEKLLVARHAYISFLIITKASRRVKNDIQDS